MYSFYIMIGISHKYSVSGQYFYIHLLKNQPLVRYFDDVVWK